MAFQIAMYNKQWASQVVQWEKNLPATKETQEIRVQFLGQEDPLEEGMATHSSIPAWRIPWTGAWPGYSPCGHRESETTEAAEHGRTINSIQC